MEDTIDIHPEEKSVEEVKDFIPMLIKDFESEIYYSQNPVLRNNLRQCYNEGIRQSIARISSEYSFNGRQLEHVKHLIRILEENLIST